MARAVQPVRAGLVVRAVPGGWTVATRTGRTRMARTLEELLDVVVPNAADDRAGLRNRLLEAAAAVDVTAV